VSVVAITVEGVLRKIFGGSSIKAGVDLYYGLATRAKLVLLTGERSTDGGLEHWLRSEGMKEHVRILWSDVVLQGESPAAERLAELAHARQNGYDIEFVIEPDPEVSKRLIIAGYNTLTFTHAEYSVPSWRPDAKIEVTPWDELAAQVDRESYLRMNDPRKEEK
jgi:hypothetical protein